MSRAYKKHYPGEVISNGATLIKRVTPQKWEIECACGETFVSQVAGCNGRCAKCGSKVTALKNTKHGEAHKSGKNASRLYNIWLGIKARCYNPNIDSYTYYGNRGIKMCDEWKDDYIAFKEWALDNGYTDELSINRIDNDGNYTPSNCNWTTQKEQMRNTRNNHYITYQGETMTLAEASERFGIPYSTLKRRINAYGYSDERAISQPIRRRNYGN